ncbi:MAG: hypothetical protein KAU50_09700 [Candidatus Marinimicrobia bacterium]|nr:hypothetical protein [Candidatus Neomarinimicrobiota bacterium]
MKKLFIALFLLFLPLQAGAATYYVRADGTAVNKAAATGPGNIQANCMNMTVHNGETFSAGDVVKVCDDGGAYRFTLVPPSDGSAGNVITYEAETGDAPVIKTTELKSGSDWSLWYDSGGTKIYRATVTQPYTYIPVRNDVRMPYHPWWTSWSIAQIQANMIDEYYYSASGSTYAYIRRDDTNVGNIEIPARQNAIQIDYYRNYLTFDGLTLCGGVGAATSIGTIYRTAVSVLWGADHITFRNMEVKFAYNAGWHSTNTHITWDSCEIHNCRFGLYFAGGYTGKGWTTYPVQGTQDCTDLLIDKCKIHNIGEYYSDYGDRECLGMNGVKDVVISNSYFYSNGYDHTSPVNVNSALVSVVNSQNISTYNCYFYDSSGSQLHYSGGELGVDGGEVRYCIFDSWKQHNTTHGNGKTALYLGDSSYINRCNHVPYGSCQSMGDHYVENNLFINGPAEGSTHYHSSLNIQFEHFNKLYIRNNTFYLNNTWYDFSDFSYGINDADFSNNYIYRTSGANAIYDHATIYDHAHIDGAGAGYWEHDRAAASNITNADPLLNSVVADPTNVKDLQDGSPCIDAGVDTGYPDGLNAASDFTASPPSILTLKNTDYGSPPYYEIGPFVKQAAGEDPPGGTNDVSTDPDCFLLMRMEDGAHTTDTRRSHTIGTGAAADSETTLYREGAASADFVDANSDYYYITDANLVAGYPLKNGDAQKIISICAWVRVQDTGVDHHPIYSKGVFGAANTRSIATRIEDIGVDDWRARIAIGHTNGTLNESYNHDSILLANTWYHITWQFRNSDKAYAIRVRDTSGVVVGSDLTGTATNNISVLAGQVEIGRLNLDIPDYHMSGLIDELIVFDKYLTADNSTDISKGEYGEPAISPQSMSGGNTTIPGTHRLTIPYDRELFVENGSPYFPITYDWPGVVVYYYAGKGGIGSLDTYWDAMILVGYRLSAFVDGVISDDITVPSGCIMTDAQNSATVVTGALTGLASYPAGMVTVPFSSTDPFLLGTGPGASWIDMPTAVAAGWYGVPGDHIKYNSEITETSFNTTGSGTAENPIIVLSGGAPVTLTNPVIDEDYWTFTRLIIPNATIPAGSDGIKFKRCRTKP